MLNDVADPVANERPAFQAANPTGDPEMILRIDHATIDQMRNLRVRGWAVSHSPIETIEIYADEALLGGAQYGIARSDVANEFPHFPDAMASGFQFEGSSAPAPGTKVIRAVAKSTNGCTATFEIEYQRDELYCDYVSVLDSGEISLSGWAVSYAGVGAIVVLFEDVEIGSAQYRSERPDVEAIFPYAPDSRHSGFEFRATIDRAHVGRLNRIVVRLIRKDGGTTDIPMQIHAKAAEATQPVPPDESEIQIHIDEPAIENGAAQSPVVGNLSISGWAIASQGVASVTLALDGRSIGAAYYGIRRDDVRKAYPAIAKSANPGFTISLPYRTLTEGNHLIGVTVVANNGVRKETNFSIIVAHSPAFTRLHGLRRSVQISEREFAAAVVGGLKPQPSFLVCISVNRRNLYELAATLRSLEEQLYPNWSVLLSGDSCFTARVEEIIAAECSGLQSRITVFPESGAHSSVSQPPQCDLILVLESGDLLSADAMFEFAWAAFSNDQDDFFYADECRKNSAAERADVFFKPEWSPDLLLATNYIGRPVCVRSELLRRADISLEKVYLESPYDLTLRCTEVSSGITHIPKVLCETTVDPNEATRDSLLRAMKRRGRNARVESGRLMNSCRVRPENPCMELVSIIIPTCAAQGMIKRCIDSLRMISSYKNIEIVCIDNIADGSSEWKMWLRENADLVLEELGDFNWSQFNNFAAKAASGSFLLFLNDDVEIEQTDWLECMLEPFQISDAAIVGARLLYPDRRVQHAGVFLSKHGVGRHAFRYHDEHNPGYHGLALTTRNVIGVTGACMLVRKTTFIGLGGFDERHAIINNDLDFCLRAHQRNLFCVYTPYATLLHHEATSRAAMPETFDVAEFHTRWSDLWSSGDPYFHHSLDSDNDTFQAQPEPTNTLFCKSPVYAPETIQRILVVKVDHIGDFITALPAIRRLKAIFPHSHITAVVAPASQYLANLESSIDETLIFEFFHARSQLGEKEIESQQLRQLGDALAARRFDLAVDLRKHCETRALLQLAQARITAGFDHRSQFSWLDISLPWEGDVQLQEKSHHISNDLINLVNAIDSAGSADRSILKGRADWSAHQRPIIARLSDAGMFSRRVVCIHPGAGNDNKIWPARHFATLINSLVAVEDVDCALIGGPDEAEITVKILALIKAHDRVYDLSGGLTLAELPYFMDLCALFVGNDSGPKHIAAAVGVPTIGIHSGVIDAREFGPLGKFAVAVKRDMACAPCYLVKRSDCHRGVACLEELPPSYILPLSRKLLVIGHGYIRENRVSGAYGDAQEQPLHICNLADLGAIV